jgi:hypothetical protein
MVLRNGLRQVLVRFVELRRLVDEVEQSERVELEQVNHRLVVLKPNVVRKLLEPFLQELILLLLKDVTHVKLLQFLIGEIDKELLKRVHPQYLKSENVEQSNTLAKTSFALLKTHLLQLNLLIEFHNQKHKSTLVYVLREGVLQSHCLIIAQGGVDDTRPHFPSLKLETMLQSR